MRTILLAAAAALALGTGSAFAGDSGDAPATTAFTIVADQLAHHPVQKQAAKTMDQTPSTTTINAAQGRNLGTWLFPPSQGGGQQ